MVRRRGEGTVYRRQDGRYEGALYVTTASGRRKRRRVYGRSWDEAHEALTKVKRQEQQGVPFPDRTWTIGAYLDYWLSEVAAHRVRPSTLRTYSMYAKDHLIPGLGKRRLHRLTAQHLRAFLNERRESGLSPRTVHHLHAVLRNALEHAVREDLLTRNVARQVRFSPGHREEIEPYSVDEARRLLVAIRDDRLYALYAVALSLGLRRGEALGLRWSDIDLAGGVIHVRRSLQRVDGRLVLVPTKTRRSRRTVPLGPVLTKTLKEHRVRQAADRMAAGSRWQDSDLVFATLSGAPLEPNDISKRFPKLCEAAGLRRIRLHDLRHTCASLLLAQGHSPRVVMEILGHSSLDVTMNIYGHVRLEAQREAIAATDLLIPAVKVSRRGYGSTSSRRSR
jgi:integrase